MPRNIDYGLSPFLIRDEDNTGEEFGKQYEPRLPVARQKKVPLIGRDENGKVKVLIPFSPDNINLDAAWIDEYGDTAVLKTDNCEEFPLTIENWRDKVLKRFNPIFPHPDDYTTICEYLTKQGFFHRDEIFGKHSDDFQRDGTITTIPPFYYRDDNDAQEPANLLPPAIDYRDDGLNDMRYYYLKNRNV